MTDKELIRCALLGSREAQQECTEKGIVLPCWRCGGESEIQELHTGGKPIYAVTCKKTYCGAYGCACSTQQKAIEYWNTRNVSLLLETSICSHEFEELFYCSDDDYKIYTNRVKIWRNGESFKKLMVCKKCGMVFAKEYNYEK